MDIQEVKEFNTINTSLTKSEDGLVLPYKVLDKLEFPCVLLSSVSGKFEKYKMSVLKGLLRTEGFMLYLVTPGGNLKVGYIDKVGVGVLKDSSVFSDFDLKVVLKRDMVLTGDMIYAVL